MNVMKEVYYSEMAGQTSLVVKRISVIFRIIQSDQSFPR